MLFSMETYRTCDFPGGGEGGGSGPPIPPLDLRMHLCICDMYKNLMWWVIWRNAWYSYGKFINAAFQSLKCFSVSLKNGKKLPYTCYTKFFVAHWSRVSEILSWVRNSYLGKPSDAKQWPWGPIFLSPPPPPPPYTHDKFLLSCCGRESWLLCFNCVLSLVWLSVFYISFSRCHGLAAILWISAPSDIKMSKNFPKWSIPYPIS